MGIAAHAMFGAKQRHKLDAGSLVEDVNGALEVIVDAAGIGHESNALALQLGKSAIT